MSASVRPAQLELGQEASWLPCPKTCLISAVSKALSAGVDTRGASSPAPPGRGCVFSGWPRRRGVGAAEQPDQEQVRAHVDVSGASGAPGFTFPLGYLVASPCEDVSHPVLVANQPWQVTAPKSLLFFPRLLRNSLLWGSFMARRS